MPFCFLIHNFAEIGQSVDELWPKKSDFQDGAGILKISIFGQETAI